MKLRRVSALAQRELARRRALHQVLEDLHDGQTRVVKAWDPRDPWEGDDPEARQSRLRGGAELVCLLTHRRWGKTEGLLRYLCWVCLVPRYHGRPRACLYVNQEREYARDVIWPILQDLVAKYGKVWGVNEKRDLDERRMRVRFPDGSLLQLAGADQKRWQRRLRGRRFDAVVIDEAQDFTFSDLEHLCKRVLLPTLADRNGRMWMAGTPGEVENYFFKVQSGFDAEEVEETRQQVVVSRGDPMWVVCRGGYLENPHTRAELQGQINRFKRANPSVEDEPWFQREYMSRWIADTRRRVVRLRPDLNYLYNWERKETDRFVLGIDFGFPEPSAYVLLTWNPDEHPWYIYIDAWERESMQVHDHVEVVREYMQEYPGLRIVGDPSWFGGKDAPSSEALVTELQQVYGLPIEPAEKKTKRFAVERLNSEASLGWVKIYNAANPSRPSESPMAQQWNALVRLPDGSEGTPRHIHDAALYARRAAAPWAYRGEVTKEVKDVKKQRGMRQARVDSLTKRRASRDRLRGLRS